MTKTKSNVGIWLVLIVLVFAIGYDIRRDEALSTDIAELKTQISALEITPAPVQAPVKNTGTFTPIVRSISLAAVSSTNEGIVGNLSVKLMPGNNNVLIDTNPFLDTEIQYSANKAVAVAKLHSPYDFDKDFIFDYKAGDTLLLGGESAGAATTIAVIAALQGKELKRDAVITGTINVDGSIGRVGGVLEKASAVANASYKYFLVPKGEGNLIYYEPVLTREDTGLGFDIMNTRYIPREINVIETAKEEWGLEVIEVSTIEEALPYFI